MEEDPAPDFSWLRRAFLSIVLTGLVLILCALGLFYARIPLVQAVAPAVLQNITGQPVTLEVAVLDLDRVEILNLEITGGPTLNRLTLIPSDSWSAGVFFEEATVEGLRAQIALLPDGTLTIRGLEGIAQSEDTSASDAPFETPLRNLILKDVSILAETPLGPQTISGTTRVTFPAAPSRGAFTLEASLESPGSESALIGSATFLNDTVAAEGTLDISLPHWMPFIPGVDQAEGRVTLQFQSSSVFTDHADAHSGKGEIAWSSVTLGLKGQPAIHLEDGLLQTRLTGEEIAIQLPEPLELYADALPGILLQTLPAEFLPYATGVPSITLSPISTNPAITVKLGDEAGPRVFFTSEIAATLGPIAVDLQPDVLSLDPSFNPDGLILRRTRLSLLRGLDLPRDVAGTLEIGLIDLDLAALQAGAPLPALDLPYSLDASIYGPIAGKLWAKSAGLQAEGLVRLRAAAEGLDMTVEPGGTLRINGLTGTGDLRLSPRLRLDTAGRDPLELGISFTDPAGTLSAKGGLRLGEFSLALPGEDAPIALSFGRQPVFFRYNAGAFALSLGAVDVQELTHDIALDDLSIRLEHGGRAGTVSLNAGSITVAGTPFLPGALTANLAFSSAQNGDVTLEGPTSFADGKVSALVTAKLNPEAIPPLQTLRVETQPIKFGAFGLSLPDILPGGVATDSTTLPDLEGNLQLTLDSENDTAGPSGHFTAGFDNFSITLREGAIRNLYTEVQFDLGRLPATVQPSEISATLHIPGLSSIPVAGQYAIDPASNLRLDEMTLELFGGSIALVETSIDTQAAELEGTIRLRRLDLQKAFELMNIQGVEASGLLSGLLPIQVSQEDAIIRGGALAAEGSGVLKINNPTVNQALASDEEAVQMVTNVLKDFRYDSLSAEVELPEREGGRILLHLAGHNPNVLDGHPFAINVNLESDFRKMFEFLQQIVDFSSFALGGQILKLR